MATNGAKRHSAAITDGPDRAGARSMLKAVGFTDEDLAKPLIGVATTWIETMPCNLNQRGERGSDGDPDSLRRNQWTLSGDWTIREQGAVLNEAHGGIAFRFHARDLHLVLKPGDSPVRFRVSLDGETPGRAHGGDVDGHGNGLASEPRLYQLIRQNGRIEDRTFEITFLDPGVEASVFTFG